MSQTKTNACVFFFFCSLFVLFVIFYSCCCCLTSSSMRRRWRSASSPDLCTFLCRNTHHRVGEPQHTQRSPYHLLYLIVINFTIQIDVSVPFLPPFPWSFWWSFTIGQVITNLRAARLTNNSTCGRKVCCNWHWNNLIVITAGNLYLSLLYSSSLDTMFRVMPVVGVVSAACGAGITATMMVLNGWDQPPAPRNKREQLEMRRWNMLGHAQNDIRNMNHLILYNTVNTPSSHTQRVRQQQITSTSSERTCWWQSPFRSNKCRQRNFLPFFFTNNRFHPLPSKHTHTSFSETQLICGVYSCTVSIRCSNEPITFFRWAHAC